MGLYVAKRLVTNMKIKGIKIQNSKILVMGLTFKENCADIRNSGIKNVINKLKLNCKLDLYDPCNINSKLRKFIIIIQF